MARLGMIALLASLVLAGCVNPQQQQKVQNDLAEMKRRLAESERAVVALRKELAKGGGQQLATVVRSQADLRADFDAFRQDVLALQGRVEEQQAGGKRFEAELAALRDELQFKVKALEERLAALEARKPAPAPAPQTLSPEDLYQQGLDAIRSGQDFAAGRKALQDFLKRYPDHHLAVNATYWIGEAWYGEKKYENAILQFQDVIEKYGDHPKVAAALLKQGLAFRALKDEANAEVIWRKLVERFPDSPEAAKARAWLKK
ncbi:tol-pal system protein YbgF [Geothermobacter ehrlichii]|uniref:Tol-pal system protein YbgF n=2 Tax=Geothermobacter ehrlichii TaxID=213224 RepID=A0A5D3WJ57_9BACT|nr:tol-pal system protein YbgF [Geothermobacter ehrlichii]